MKFSKELAPKTALITVLTIIFLWLVMVTRFQYIEERTRFNRLSGDLSVLQENGKWSSINSQEDYPRWLKKLPDYELSKTTGTARYVNSTFRADIVNKSTWKISEIDFEVKIYSREDSTFLTKRYFTGKSPSQFEGVPFTEANYRGKLPEISDEQYFTWTYAEARGYEYDGEHSQ